LGHFINSERALWKDSQPLSIPIFHVRAEVQLLQAKLAGNKKAFREIMSLMKRKDVENFYDYPHWEISTENIDELIGNSWRQGAYAGTKTSMMAVLSHTGYNPEERAADLTAREIAGRALGITGKVGPTSLGLFLKKTNKTVDDIRAEIAASNAPDGEGQLLKVAYGGEVGLAATKRNAHIDEVSLDSLHKEVFKKFNISRNDLYYWTRNNTASRKVRGRGVDLREIKTLLVSFKRTGSSEMPVTRRVFLSGTAKRAIIKNDTRQSASALSGEEYSAKIAFDNMSPRTPLVYEPVQPVAPRPLPHAEDNIQVSARVAGDTKSTVTSSRTPPNIKIRSHVNVKVTDAKVDISKVEKIIIGRLLK
jgi:hypothetical protein